LAAVFAQEGIEIVPLPRLLAEGGLTAPHAEGTLAQRTAPLTFFDSCHDRPQTHGVSIRRMLAAIPAAELSHHCRNTLCCGAGGGVSTFDAEIGDRRLDRLLREADQVGASALVTTCPTCTYTFAYKRLLATTPPELAHLGCHHYLEYLFDEPIDWQTVFNQLQEMWTGEYGDWVCSQLL
jgi:Fe-S oxidoreductase